MEYEEFISRVADEADIGFIDADIASEAFLGQLGKRLSTQELQQLEADLPEELAAYLNGGETVNLSLSNAGFYERIGRAELRDSRQAQRHAHAVWQVLLQTLDQTQISRIASHLPQDTLAELSA